MATPCYHAPPQTAIAAHLRAGGRTAQNVPGFGPLFLVKDDTHEFHVSRDVRADAARVPRTGRRSRLQFSPRRLNDISEGVQ